MAITADPTLDDGTDTVELLFENDFNDNPQVRVAEQEIAGGSSDKTSHMGEGNDKITGTILIAKDGTEYNGSPVNDIDTIEDKLKEWATNGTELTYTEDDGSTTRNMLLTVDFDKPRNITPNMIRANVTLTEA